MKNLVTLIMVIFILGFAANGFCLDTKKPTATGDAYFDIATGHKYIKNSNDTYTEYTSKGDVFKTAVPNTQPHLSSSKYIRKMSKDAYLVYKSYKNYQPVYQVLRTSEPQPEGSLSTQLLISAKQLIKQDIGLGHTSSLQPVKFNKEQTAATEKAYVDLATGHRYIKNSDSTYTEYTKKGDVFNTAVSNAQPHLLASPYVAKITDDSFLVYTNYKDYKPVEKVLSSSANHPEKWQCKEVLVSMNTSAKQTDMNNSIASANLQMK